MSPIAPRPTRTAATSFLLCLMLLAINGNALAAAAPAPTGTVKLLVGTATVATPGTAPAPLVRGDAVFPGQVIETGDRTFLRVEMADGTRFTLGKNASASIDEFSFNETTTLGKFEATVRFGGFAYASGNIGKLTTGRQHSFINTPTTVIGIRGSVAKGDVDPVTGLTRVVLESGAATVNGQTLPAGGSASTDETGSTTVSTTADTNVVNAVDSKLPTPDEVKEAETQQGGTTGTTTDETKDDETKDDETTKDDQTTKDETPTTSDKPALGSQDTTFTTEKPSTPAGEARP